MFCIQFLAVSAALSRKRSYPHTVHRSDPRRNAIATSLAHPRTSFVRLLLSEFLWTSRWSFQEPSCLRMLGVAGQLLYARLARTKLHDSCGWALQKFQPRRWATCCESSILPSTNAAGMIGPLSHQLTWGFAHGAVAAQRLTPSEPLLIRP